MLSYNWDHQPTIKRINNALKARDYAVWIDVEKMQGSTVEAMSAAVEDCAVMCYGISQAYKESTNCRMEAQYAFQQQKDMVPLMMVEGYSANGWLGMMLGVCLYYKFCGSVLASEGAFEAKMEELCRELGERGKGLSASSDSKMADAGLQLFDEARALVDFWQNVKFQPISKIMMTAGTMRFMPKVHKFAALHSSEPFAKLKSRCVENDGLSICGNFSTWLAGLPEFTC